MDHILEIIEKHRKHLEDLTQNKVAVKDDNKNRKELKKQMYMIKDDHDQLLGQQQALESYVEKYMPLKLQHQMSDTISTILDKKQKQRFYEHNETITEALREEVLKDSGHSRLKDKCLDLIQKLKLEASIINNSTGRAKVPQPNTPPKSNAEDAEINKDKPITLNDNGQIRIEHGPKEIKELIRTG